jgi:hypothetical protein
MEADGLDPAVGDADVLEESSAREKRREGGRGRPVWLQEVVGGEGRATARGWTRFVSARGWGTSSRALPARGSDTRRRSTPRLAQDGPGDSLIDYTSSEGDAMKDIASKAGLTVWARAASSASCRRASRPSTLDK